ncbi:MAG: zinc-binding dehydrogenase [Nitrospirota bacterium]
MKAAVFHQFGGPEKLRYEEYPDPVISQDEVLIKVKACSINHLDIWIRNGIPAYKTPLPHISGSDISGIVEETGDAVKGVNIGDRVFISPGISCFSCDYCLSGNDNLCRTFTIMGAGVDGGYAEYAKAKAGDIIPLPSNLSFEEGAAFPLVFLTAWHMLINRAELMPGEVALILGAGSGIGSAAIKIAHLSGAKIIAAAGNDEKLKKAKEIGADEVINYNMEEIDRKAREYTNGKGVDVIFEHIGPETWQRSILSLGKGGRIVTCGATSGPDVRLDIRYIFSRQLSIFGSIMGTRKELLHITGLMEMEKLKPVIDSVHSLNEVRKAQELMLKREIFGKLILIP